MAIPTFGHRIKKGAITWTIHKVRRNQRGLLPEREPSYRTSFIWCTIVDVKDVLCVKTGIDETTTPIAEKTINGAKSLKTM